jgi:hypothetical protein
MIVDQISSDPGISFFHIPLPIQIGNSDTRYNCYCRCLHFPESNLIFELDFEPEFISIDPNIEIISGNNKIYENLPQGSIDDLIAIFPNPGNGKIEVFAKKNGLHDASPFQSWIIVGSCCILRMLNKWL